MNCKVSCKRTQHFRPTAPNIVECYMLRPSQCTPCWVLLGVVAQSLKPVKLLSQQLPKFLLFCVRRGVAQQCWIRLHSNAVGATHAHYTWFTTSLNYGLYPSQMHYRSPHIWELLHPLAHQGQHRRNNSQQCWELLRPFALRYRGYVCCNFISLFSGALYLV